MDDGIDAAEKLANAPALEIVANDLANGPPAAGELVHEMLADEAVRSSDRNDHHRTLMASPFDG
jgi:hypothetical protein